MKADKNQKDEDSDASDDKDAGNKQEDMSGDDSDDAQDRERESAEADIREVRYILEKLCPKIDSTLFLLGHFGV